MQHARADRTHCAARAAIVLLTMLGSCTSAAAPRDTLYQVSLASALVEREYDGEVTVEELVRHGNFGLGTFDRLDGEMIVLNGTVYKARADGTVERPEPDETTPFAVVTRFRTDSQVSIDERTSLDELESMIDASVDNPNIFYALKIATRIPKVVVRSIAAQSKPYRELVSIASEQRTWTYEDIKGTLVGIRSPTYVGSMNVPGYHWHFISADREVGGHVISAELDRGAVDIDHVHAWDLQLPEGDEFGKLDLSTDRSSDLAIVEQ